MQSTSPELDLDFVRGHFPGLDDWALFENAGGTLVPQSVLDGVQAYMRESQVQPGAGYPASARATERIERAHALLAAMVNADPEEVLIGPSTTMNLYLLAQAVRPWLHAGDEVVVTNLDHEANNGAWRRLAEHGITVKEWRLDPESAELRLEDLERLLSERTRLVCFTQCSNITGSLHDVGAIVRRVHDAGALACVDAVAYAPHRPVDVRALDVDFYALSLYKLYGPHLGLLYGKREHLLRARAQNHYFIGEDQIPLKLLPGGVNHELTAASAGIVEYFDAVHAHHFPGSNADLHQRFEDVFGLVARHEERLGRRFLDFLRTKPGVRLIGRDTASPARRVPTFSFAVTGRDSEELPRRLEARRFAIRAGHFYAARCIDALGLGAQNGVVRASMVHYNTLREVERLTEALDEVL